MADSTNEEKTFLEKLNLTSSEFGFLTFFWVGMCILVSVVDPKVITGEFIRRPKTSPVNCQWCAGAFGHFVIAPGLLRLHHSDHALAVRRVRDATL